MGIASSIRFGPGCTRELGMDFANMQARKVLVVTDKTVARLRPMKVAIEALESQGIKYEVYDNVHVEPKVCHIPPESPPPPSSIQSN